MRIDLRAKKSKKQKRKTTATKRNGKKKESITNLDKWVLYIYIIDKGVNPLIFFAKNLFSNKSLNTPPFDKQLIFIILYLM